MQGQLGGSAPEGMTAETVSEAENIAEENFVEEVDYSGLGVDTCNQINHALSANEDIDFEDEPIKEISSGDALVLGTSNAYVSENGEIVINPSTMGNAERFSEICKQTNEQERFQQPTQEDLDKAEAEMEEVQEEILEEVPEEDQERAQELIEEGHGKGVAARMPIDNELNQLMGHDEEDSFDERIIEERKKYGDMQNLEENMAEDNFVAQWGYESVNDVITHEIGHELTRRKLEEAGMIEEGYGQQDPYELAEAMPEWQEEYNITDWNYEEHMEAKRNISEYSDTNAHEYIAESYLAYERGDEIHPDMERFIEGELKNDNE